MTSALTSQQYRELAEGLLKNAIDAPEGKKQEFIRVAIVYLAYARAQDEQSPTSAFDSMESRNPDDAESQYRQIRQLIKQALEVATPDGLEKFLEFTTSFWRLSIWNARMAYIQRPGARIIADVTEVESSTTASDRKPYRDTLPNRGATMRESIIIAAVIGSFFFMATAAMAAIAIPYATPSLLWISFFGAGSRE